MGQCCPCRRVVVRLAGMQRDGQQPIRASPVLEGFDGQAIARHSQGPGKGGVPVRAGMAAFGPALQLQPKRDFPSRVAVCRLCPAPQSMTLAPMHKTGVHGGRPASVENFRPLAGSLHRITGGPLGGLGQLPDAAEEGLNLLIGVRHGESLLAPPLLRIPEAASPPEEATYPSVLRCSDRRVSARHWLPNARLVSYRPEGNRLPGPARPAPAHPRRMLSCQRSRSRKSTIAP